MSRYRLEVGRQQQTGLHFTAIHDALEPRQSDALKRGLGIGSLIMNAQLHGRCFNEVDTDYGIRYTEFAVGSRVLTVAQKTIVDVAHLIERSLHYNGHSVIVDEEVKPLDEDYRFFQNIIDGIRTDRSPSHE